MSSVGKSAPRCTCESAGGKNEPYGGLAPEAELLAFGLVASLPEAVAVGCTEDCNKVEKPPGGTLDGKLLIVGLPIRDAISEAPPELLFPEEEFWPFSPNGGCWCCVYVRMYIGVCMYVCMYVCMCVYIYL